MKKDITELFFIDDFCKIYGCYEKERLLPSNKRRHHAARMGLSKMLTILIMFHGSYAKNFKYFYKSYIEYLHKEDFPQTLSYNRFVELMPRLFMPLNVLMHYNLEEYLHPKLYDAEYGKYQDDIPFFLESINSGKVLDLACGTGRIAIPFAKKGFKVTGLDASPQMLERAQEKSQGLDIKYILGDMSNFTLNEQFDLIIMAGNAFQALLTEHDQLSMLQCVKKHLTPKGYFIFNTRNPVTEDLTTSYEFEFWHNFIDHDNTEVKVYGRQDYDENTKIATYKTKRIWPHHETQTSIQLRFSLLEEIKRLLDQTGFKLDNIYGDFNKSSLYPASNAIIPICCLQNT